MGLASNTSILLIHDQELADVRATLDDLGLGFVESRPGETSREACESAGILIASPRFLLDRSEVGDSGRVTRIAITEGESKTLRTMLDRSGIEWQVRRPFHPEALRLLLLHCIYQGPEKRKTRRVSIGAAVHYQAGWRRRGALLAELSPHDCRFLTSRPVAVGKRLKLRLPAELAGRRPLVLDGRVVRTDRASEGDGAHEVCVLFDPLGSNEALRLKELVEAHAQGPAMLGGAAARHLARNRPRDPGEPGRGTHSVISCHSLGEQAEGEGTSADAPERAGEERRGDPRHAFSRRVIALGEQATRVLVGRDISLRGMRVDPSRILHLGQELQVAIHVPGNDTPLVLDACVDRDDGARGMVLGFRDLSPTAAAYLEGVLADLPVFQTTSSASGSAMVVSEIVDSAD